jgi:addiction module HigA family antidote
VLRRLIAERMNVNHSEIARVMGISRVRMSQIINGRAPISAGMALRLSRITGMSAQHWLKLQMKLDLFRAEELLRTELRELPNLTETAHITRRSASVESAEPRACRG